MEENCSAKQHWRAEEAIAGNVVALQALRELIIYPLIYSREASILGLKGLLLYGPPGTGKTSLVRAVVKESGAHLTLIRPQSVHKAHAGESERFLREAFSQAHAHASSGKPSVIFIDEIDAICPRRSSRRENEARVVGQLLTLMDGSNYSSESVQRVAVVASTNRVDGVDPALRRPGRFDSEVEVSIPSMEERLQILELHTRKLHLDGGVDLQAIVASCNGYWALTWRHCAGRRPCLPGGDWEYARSEVGPSITRGIAKEASKVSWEDIGGLKDLKKKLQQAVEWPIKHADAFARLRISPVRGILLHGPPGCSKTTLAKATAHAAQAAFFTLSVAELYSKYVGEGEALLRRIFLKARHSAPSIIFFDEIDGIAPSRGSHGGSSGGNSSVGERLLSTLLTEMDGLELANGILVLAATNRPMQSIPLSGVQAASIWYSSFSPSPYYLFQIKRYSVIRPAAGFRGRREILRVHTRRMELAKDVDLEQIAEGAELFTGADLEGLCREAGMLALREDPSAGSVSGRHFWAARACLRPSLTQSQIDEYLAFMKTLALG
ncbi:unnamed protein product [Spirodela intermedia]|uniref:AAA+ ATPase domain-containing protein n=1 Tax=Spirodela intermedia TaxID=51605 RepID=A0A7I8I8X3_SPIIN|nr:unnamed protein product [Spirodela intermedia]CAA6653512.1 unnamed protein product [Spirodela intermedia]